jgi:multidrug resistance efflux pump
MNKNTETSNSAALSKDAQKIQQTSLAAESETPHLFVATNALSLVKSPLFARHLAKIIGLIILIFSLALVYVPWQQTIYGTGSVTSFVPGVRPQTLEAPINGRIAKWYFNEGDKVQQGDTLVELQDLNLNFMSEDVIRRLEEVRDGTIASQEFSIQVAQEKVEQTRQKYESARATADNAVIDIDVARIQLRRAEILLKDGLVSERDLETATLRFQKAVADSVKAFRTLEAERRAVLEAENYEQEVTEKARAEINKARLSVENAQVRRGAGVITAPFSGTLVRVQKPGLGETVKEGDILAQLLPSSKDQAVELYISSRDAAIVDPGRPVRLQFSGFPAFIFSGWSNLSINTFG